MLVHQFLNLEGALDVLRIMNGDKRLLPLGQAAWQHCQLSVI